MRHLPLSSFLLVVALAGCNGSAPKEAATPSLPIAIRDEMRDQALEAFAANVDGNHSSVQSTVKGLALNQVLKVSVQSEANDLLPAADAKKHVQEAAQGWNSALKGTARVEVTDDPNGADVMIVFRPSVIETMGSASMVGCWDVQTKDGGKQEIAVSIKQPGSNNTHPPRSLVHNAAKGIGYILGLNKQKGTGLLMATDTHDEKVPTAPTEGEADAVRGFYAFVEEVGKASAGSKKVDLKLGELEIAETTFDAGKVWRGQSAVGKYKIKNVGTAPVEIRMDASCGCTVPEYPKTLGAGEEAEVKVELDTKGTSGTVSKSVQVVTNGVGQKTSLVIKANVQPTFVSEPDVRGGIQVLKPNQVQVLKIRSVQDPKSSVTAVKATQKFLSTKIVGKEGPVTTVELVFGPDTPFGKTGFLLTVDTDSKTEKSFTIPISVEKGILVDPPSLWFGNVSPGNSGRTVRAALIKRPGKPFKIVGIKAEDPNLAVRYEEILKGTEYRLFAEYAGGWTAGSQRSKIEIQTDDPDQKIITVNASAFVR